MPLANEIQRELLATCENTKQEITNITVYAENLNLDVLSHAEQFDAIAVLLRMLDRVTIIHNILRDESRNAQHVPPQGIESE